MINPSEKDIPQIIFALVIAILPHVGRLPVWIVLWCALMWGYLLLSLKNRWVRPGRMVRVVLACTGFTGILLTYPRIGPDAYLGLLAVMSGVKPFEIASHRDRMITLCLAYFIVITSLFQSETLSITLYMFVSVWITTAVLIRINDPGGRFLTHLGLSGKIIAQAVPLMVVLFLVFPRIEGSLFGMMRTHDGKTGFSETLSPGNIARLAENPEIAFRAQFAGRIPPMALQYWRGIVFYAFDGRTWKPGPPVPERSVPPEGENPFSYTVTLEPHAQRWLFALDVAGQVPPLASMREDFTLYRRFPVTRTLRYDMVSHTRHDTGAISLRERRRCLQLPRRSNPRARQLAAEISRGADTVPEKIDQVLAYLKTGGFVYTLNPPVLPGNAVDAFLFDARKGYCEHFASAFVFLMRAMNVPARIVGGYLGGEVNPYGGYLVVRQSDAHAWAEVFSEKGGWVRVDPTSAVAPERISEGMEGWLLDAGAGPGAVGYFKPVLGWIDQVRFGWDAVNTQYQAWFSGYSHAEQRAMLERMGIHRDTLRAGLQMAALIVFIGMFSGISFWLLIKTPSRGKVDRAARYYEKFCQKMNRAGILRNPSRGPLDFARMISQARPDLEPEAAEIIDLYLRIRYGEDASPADVLEFKVKVGRFKPKKMGSLSL